MKKKESTASISYRLCQHLRLPCFVLCLFTSMTLLYKNWETTNLTPKYHAQSTVPTRSRIAFVTAVTIPAKRTPTEVLAKLTFADRFSPELHTKSSKFQTDSNPKLASTEPSLPETQSTSSELLPDLSLKPDPEKRSSTELRQAPLSTKLSPDVQPTIPAERRRSLLIYGADRSGTTFTTKMFATDPQLMTVYEPLWITQEMEQRRQFTDQKLEEKCSRSSQGNFELQIRR